MTFTKKLNDIDCVICEVGRTKNGKANFTLEKNGTSPIDKNVDANVCDTAEKPIFSIETSRKIEKLSNEAVNKVAELEVVKF